MKDKDKSRIRIDLAQILRHLIQTAAFILFPGLFLSAFNAVKDVTTALVSGSYHFPDLAGQTVMLAIMFLMTALWGRFFCGYLCSFGAVQDLTAWISRLLHGRHSVSPGTDKALKHLKYAVLAAIVIPLWILQLPVDTGLSPWGVFGAITSLNPSAILSAIPTIGFAVLILIFIGSFFVERMFCRYLCPLGAALSLVSFFRIFRIRRDTDACSRCGLCSKKCPMGINIHDRRTVSSGECINCMRCIGSCRRSAINSDPHPALAGTAAAAVMCGLVSVGNIAVSKAYATESPADPPDDALIGSVAVSGTDDTQTAWQYADGTYTGTGDGLRGEINVSVTVENGLISDITVLSHRDDLEFFRKAQNGVVADILKQQTADVDTVSGATFSSKGIIDAVAEALDMGRLAASGMSSETEDTDVSEEKSPAVSVPDTEPESRDNEEPSQNISDNSYDPVPETSEDAETDLTDNDGTEAEQQGAYSDGVYTGSGTGLRGTTQVRVTVENGAIADITVLSYADDYQFFSRAESGMIDRILDSQGIDVATVSGATFSSNGILEAVADALGLSFTNPNSSSGGKHGRN